MMKSTFSANEDQNMMWGVKGQKMIKPKSRGAGIMESDFIDEFNGFLSLSDKEYESAKAANRGIGRYARQFLEIGETREGYRTKDKFVAQMEMAVKIAKVKYPKSSGWRHV